MHAKGDRNMERGGWIKDINGEKDKYTIKLAGA